MNKLIVALIATFLVGASLASTSLTAYGTYWDGQDSGQGGGLRLKKTILAFSAVEARGGYVSFDDTQTDIVPLDVSINARLPFFISPYIGIGAGYYITSSDTPGFDNEVGYFGQLGVEATFIWFGAMAEIRYHDIGGATGAYLEGPSYNIGLLFKW